MSASRDKKALHESKRAAEATIKDAMLVVEATFKKLNELEAKIADRTLSPAFRKAARIERQQLIAGSSLERYEQTEAAGTIHRSRKTSQDHEADAIQQEQNAKRFDAVSDSVRAKKARAAAAKSRVKAAQFSKAGK